MARWRLRQTAKTGTQTVSVAVRIIKSYITWPAELITKLVIAIGDLRQDCPPQIGVLGLDTVVAFFADNGPKAGQGAAAGAVLRRAAVDGFVVRLMFLDADGNPLVDEADGAPTRSYCVTGFDEELSSAFGSHDIVILT
jgi:hypothetical protein